MNTLNIDTSKIEKAINKDTCAIFAVNLLGNSCNFNKLNEIAQKHDLILLEDNCESLGVNIGYRYTLWNSRSYGKFLLLL